MDFSRHLFIFCYFSFTFTVDFSLSFSSRRRRESVEMHISIVGGKLSKKWAKEEKKKPIQIAVKIERRYYRNKFLLFSPSCAVSFFTPIYVCPQSSSPLWVAYFTRCRQQQANFRLLRLENAENSRFKLLNRITIKAILKILCSSTKCWIIIGLWQGESAKNGFFGFATFLSRYIFEAWFFYFNHVFWWIFAPQWSEKLISTFLLRVNPFSCLEFYC